MRAFDDAASIARAPWTEVRGRLERFWLPGVTPHQSLIAQTGGGKSYLIANGILPLIEDENVVIIDVKGDDPTLSEIGKPVRKLPSRFSRSFNEWISEGKPRENWYRLAVSDDWTVARNQVGKILEMVYSEGNWTVVLDETRSLTDSRTPGLNLGPYVEQLWIRGRSRKVCVVAATQGPRWVPRSFYDQAQFHWIGAVEDEESRKRLREIGGLEKHHLETLHKLPQYHYVYTDRLDESGVRYRAVTKAD